MRSSQILSSIAAPFLAFAGIANAAYAIEDTYDATNFFEDFSFFTAADPTQGFVKYASAASANSTGMATISNGAVHLGVDHTTVNPAGGRASTRLTSNKAYTHGLFIADIAHMPGGICGVWPAFWMFGPNWPASGEIDIIEGVNTQSTNSITLHTSAGCTMVSTGAISSSVLATPNCNTGNGGTGCSTSTTNTQGYGAGFNAIGGGVYAMQWTSTAIKVYFFPRNAIPGDIISGRPNPATWGFPVAAFSGNGCNIEQHFMNQNLVFDTTFCGQWAGATWSVESQYFAQSSITDPTSPPYSYTTNLSFLRYSNLTDTNRNTDICRSLAPTCNAYVGANPSAFTNAFWTINSVKVYQDPLARKRDAIAVPFSA